MGFNVEPSEINGIVECLGDASAVIVSDFEKVLIGRSLRKAAVIILMLKSLNKVGSKFESSRVGKPPIYRRLHWRLSSNGGRIFSLLLSEPIRCCF